MEDLKLSEQDLAKQSEIIKGALGLFSDGSIRRNNYIDISGYQKIFTAYYYSRTCRANVIECIERDTSNLAGIGATFVTLDENSIEG